MAPLTVNATNPRYFDSGNGRALVLTGSHNWFTTQDYDDASPPAAFNFTAWLDYMEARGHNYMRGWYWESPKWFYNNFPHFDGFLDGDNFVAPLAYERTGPGTATDGLPKFDTSTFDQDYFDRIRTRAIAAGDRGIYMSIMLFQGFSLQDSSRPPIHDTWQNHPFNPDNNINGTDGDSNNDIEGYECHTLSLPSITHLQELYVEKVIDTVNDLDNVFFEIANESTPESALWQNHMVDYIHTYEDGKAKQHLVCYSVPLGTIGISLTSQIVNSNAEIVSLGVAEGYRDEPLINTGNKIIFNDTDHNFGIGGDRIWAWKSFTRGLHPIFMDPYTSTTAEYTSLKLNLGYILDYSERMDLVNMVPVENRSSSSYCLAKVGTPGEYLAFFPSLASGRMLMDLTQTSGTILVEWLNPSNGSISPASNVVGGSGASHIFAAPFNGDAVLYLKSQVVTGRIATSARPSQGAKVATGARIASNARASV